MLKNIPNDKLDYYERLWIAKLNSQVPNGYNISPGGGVLRGSENPMYGKPSPNRGKKRPEVSKKMKEWRAKPEVKEYYSKIMSGERNPMYGKHHSDETKKKLSERMSGKNNPMYGVRKFGEDNSFYGKHHTDETKKRISDAHAKDRKPIAQYNIKTNELIQVFDSIADAERWLRANGYPKADGSACSKVARGK